MKKRMILPVLMIGMILFCGVVVLLIFHHKEESNDNKKEIISTIEKYHYVLEENQSSLYKKYFYALANTTEENEVISLIAKLFVTDFYTLQGKKNKNDIGGIQFLYPSIQSNFILKAQNTVYKYISTTEDELPEVREVKINTLENYSLKPFEEAYRLVLEILYEKNLGYPSSASIIVVKENDQFYIVEID